MPEAIRFYLDEHVASAVASGLRRRGVDVVTAQEANMLGVCDADHVALATGSDRVVFTQDADFLRLHAAGIHHAGIAYAPTTDSRRRHREGSNVDIPGARRRRYAGPHRVPVIVASLMGC